MLNKPSFEKYDNLSTQDLIYIIYFYPDSKRTMYWLAHKTPRIFRINSLQMNVCYNTVTMSEDIKNSDLEKDASISEASKDAQNRGIIIGASILLIVLIAGLVLAVIAMVNHPDQTETIRDIVIIFMAVESLLIGLTLVILIIQLARLTALLQNEIKPILDSTNDTVDTLRGTTQFLSNNLVKPVMKVNSTASALRQALSFLKIDRSKSKE